MGLSCSLGNNHIPKASKVLVASKSNHVLKREKTPPWEHDYSQEKKV
jgi:hypothetical protein